MKAKARKLSLNKTLVANLNDLQILNSDEIQIQLKRGGLVVNTPDCPTYFAPPCPIELVTVICTILDGCSYLCALGGA